MLTRPAPTPSLDASGFAPAGYRRDIDGLRAVAVVPVVLFHAGVPFFQGGYVGVDVFFVISGYLITLKILQDLAADRFSTVAFYERRIRRIVPALAFTMALTFVVAVLVLLPPAMADFSQSLAATASFLSNTYFWKTSGYFDVAAHTRPLLHTWSLAVEEQFYIFIPIVMYLAYRWLRNWITVLFAVSAASSLALSIAVTARAPTANFFLLPTRAWELLIGSLLALSPGLAIRSRPVAEITAVLGLGMVTFAVTRFTADTPFPGAAALLPTLGAALIIVVGRQNQTLTSRLLSTGPLVFVGLISYSLYLIHWPLVVFTRYWLLSEPTTPYIGLIVVASIAMAYLSWRFIERPFRRPSKISPRHLLFAATATVLLVFGCIGVVGSATGGFPARFPAYRDHQSTNPPRDAWKVGICFLVNQTHDAWRPDACTRTTGATENALLWGDSFAAHYAPGLLRNEKQFNANIFQYTFAGCPPILSYKSFAIPGCHDFNRHALDVIKQLNIKSVILSTRWDLLRGRGFDDLQETVAELEKAGVKIYVIGQSPTFAFDTNVLAYRRAGIGDDGSAAWPISFDPMENRRIAAVAGSGTFIDPLSFLCRGTRCTYMKQHVHLYYDYGHFSAFGSDLAVRSYFPLYRPAILAPAAPSDLRRGR